MSQPALPTVDHSKQIVVPDSGSIFVSNGRSVAKRIDMTSRIVLSITAAAALGCIAAQAQSAVPTRAETLDDDLSGPAINWLGTISTVIHDADDTCFVLERLPLEYAAPRGPAFAACSGGELVGEAYVPGAVLRVKGNLGPGLKRHVGSQILDMPLVAAAYVEPVSADSYQAAPYPRPYYYYDPWYGPYGYYPPGISLGFSYHHHHR
jgi:hypothetical protein